MPFFTPYFRSFAKTIYMRILIFLFLFTSCFNVERNCSDYATGTFEFEYVDKGKTKKGYFVRSKTLNIDYFDNKIDSASIRWINDCEFIQKKINPKNRKEEVAIHMKILSTRANSYTFEYSIAAPDAIKKRRVEKGQAFRSNKTF